MEYTIEMANDLHKIPYKNLKMRKILESIDLFEIICLVDLFSIQKHEFFLSNLSHVNC